MPARHEQIGERAVHEQAMSVLRRSAIAHLAKAKHPLNDPDRMLDPCSGRMLSDRLVRLQPRQFSFIGAFRVGVGPNALEAELIGKSQDSGIMLARPGCGQRLDYRTMILRFQILKTGTPDVPIATVTRTFE